MAAALLVTCALAFFVEVRLNEGMRQVLIYRGEDGFWVAECPSLSGCVGQGETQDSARSL